MVLVLFSDSIQIGLTEPTNPSDHYKWFEWFRSGTDAVVRRVYDVAGLG